jgi:hypothetical protein
LAKAVFAISSVMEYGGEKMKNGLVHRLILGIVVVFSFLLSSNIYAAMVYTRLMDTSYLMSKWYDYISGSNGNLSFSSTSLSGGTLYTQDNVYTLTLTGKITFTPTLIRDYSSDGLAKGYFDGGVAVTITGGLRQGSTYVYGGSVFSGANANAKQIFAGTLVPVYDDPLNPTANRWSFEEEAMESGRFDRTLLLQLVADSEGLAHGIQIGSDTLIMRDPKMDLSLKATVNPNNFISTDLSSGTTASNVKITGVPEPMTLALLGIGALLVCRRK